MTETRLWLAVLAATVAIQTAAAEKPVVLGGWSPAAPDEPAVMAAAASAISARAAATGEDIRLVSIQQAQKQVVAGINYRLTLAVLRESKPRVATAVVWARLDGSRRLTQWSWKE